MFHTDHSDAVTAGPQLESRRPFMIRFAAGFLGALVGIVPLAAGTVAFLNPLVKRKGSGAERSVRITPLACVPDDGEPRRFPVIMDRHDAWNHYPPAPVGSVYLRRLPGEETPEAFSATCPHLGCIVDFTAQSQEFRCPCHNSFFNIDGQRLNPSSCPSPRDLDSLKCEVKGDDVFVTYQRFRGGVEDKIVE